MCARRGRRQWFGRHGIERHAPRATSDRPPRPARIIVHTIAPIITMQGSANSRYPTGQSVPGHVCDPLVSPDHGPHDHAAAARADQAHGHGRGSHAGMSMDAIARDIRNRFLVALAFTILVVLWSNVGKNLLGTRTRHAVRDRPRRLAAPAEPADRLLRLDDLLHRRRLRAERANPGDMMVLVAVAIGIGFAYSVAVTFGLSGDTFYDAAAMLATFVLLGHWFEMRARGGANDAIRALLDLAPPKATVVRDGEAVEIATAEVQVGDTLLIRPGSARRSTGTARCGPARSPSAPIGT